MLKNHIKLTWRHLRRRKIFSAINIFGLAVGMACSVLVMVYVYDELSFDRFHDRSDRIYRIVSKGLFIDFQINQTGTPYPLAETLRDDYPDNFLVTQIARAGKPLIRAGEKNFLEERSIAADPSFFDVFTFPLTAGDPRSVLSEPNQAVISESSAKRLFGESDPMGQIFQMNDADYKISGIMSDVPQNSHFHFDIVYSITSLSWYGESHWLNNNYSTYVAVPENFSMARLETRLDELVEKNVKQYMKGENNWWKYELEPMTKIHLHSDLNGPFGVNNKIEYVTLFSLISLFILLIACANYMNLTSAQLIKRAKEVGVRKVVGSKRMQIIKQLLAESVTLAVLGMVFASILVKISIPLLSSLAGKSLNIHYLNNIYVLPGIFLLAVIIGIVSGLYPALILSSFKPVTALKGTPAGSRGQFLMRKGLVVFQFTISIFLFVSTLIIMKQMDHFQSRSLGYDREQVVVVRNAGLLEHQTGAFKDSLLQYSGIVNATGSSALPTYGHSNWAIRPENMAQATLDIYVCDENFLDTLKMEITQGRFFSREFGTNDQSLILNEEAVKQFGWNENPLGKRIHINRNDYTVIGVVKDFHYESLHQKVEKLGIIHLSGLPNNRESYVSARIQTANVAETLSQIEKAWKAFLPNVPFEYSFLDEDYDRMYSNEQRIKKVALVFSILAVFISALGLFGLSTFSAEQRTKEIGIRKVLGATDSKIFVLLSKEFIRWVMLANAIAWPIAYYVANRWLKNFAYRIDIGMASFLLAGGTALLIAYFTVSYQSVRSARANPVDSLRYE